MIKFTPSSAAGFSEAIKKLQAAGKKSASDATLQGAIWFCQSARKATPKSKAKRPIVKIKKREINPRYRWMYEHTTHNIVAYNKNGTIRLIPTGDTQDPRRKIKYQGAAKNAWAGCIRKLNKKAGLVGGKHAGIAKTYSDVKDRHKSKKPAVEVANQVYYIEKLDRGSSTNEPHHIMAKAKHNTIKRIEIYLANKAAREMEKQWR